MTDLARIRILYHELSTEDLIDSYALGRDRYLPETWSVIEEELASRRIDASGPLVKRAIEAREPAPPVSASARLERGALTAFVLAAFFFLVGASDLFRYAPLERAVFPFWAGSVYALAAVRMKQTPSALAAAIALVLTVAIVGYRLLDTLEVGSLSLAIGDIVFLAPIYLFFNAAKAATALKRAAAASRVTRRP